jgi:hypothetical protein
VWESTSNTINRTYHVLFVGKHQDDTVEHKWIFDDGLKEKVVVNLELFLTLAWYNLHTFLNTQPEILP